MQAPGLAPEEMNPVKNGPRTIRTLGAMGSKGGSKTPGRMSARGGTAAQVARLTGFDPAIFALTGR